MRTTPSFMEEKQDNLTIVAEKLLRPVLIYDGD
jgi:hypothetical protein